MCLFNIDLSLLTCIQFVRVRFALGIPLTFLKHENMKLNMLIAVFIDGLSRYKMRGLEEHHQRLREHATQQPVWLCGRVQVYRGFPTEGLPGPRVPGGRKLEWLGARMLPGLHR